MTPGRTLPIYALETGLRDALRDASGCVVKAPTGSGKSTQIPQMLVDHGVGAGRQVVVLQPRRLAARMLARRVARERGGGLGDEVGYQVRFDRRCAAATRIVFETDGIILRRLADDPALADVGVIVFDEFHERHLYGDLMLALALRLQQTQRPDLKIVVMSATLSDAALAAYLGDCPVLASEGRQYPVDIRYVPSRRRGQPVWDQVADALGSHPPTARGNVLIFMPGAYEIRRTIDALRRSPAARGHEILPLHGGLKPDEQDAAVTPGGRPRIVVSTNVAETSLTIDGVTQVIDAGLARKPGFDPRRGIGTLLIEKISRASADQRAGRAGRVAPGQCLRLWSEKDHAARPAEETPEIQRLDLADTLLRLKMLGVDGFDAVNWLDAPPAEAVVAARELLGDLGAIKRNGTLTATGRRMAAFPLTPRHARMLLEAGQRLCVPRVAVIAALTQARSLLLPRQNRDVREHRRDVCRSDEHGSEALALEELWREARRSSFDRDACDRLGIRMTTARQVARLADQFCDVGHAEGIDVISDDGDDVAVVKCVLAGFADRVGRRLNATSPRSEMVHGRRGSVEVAIEPAPRELFVAVETQEIGMSRGDVEVRLSMVSAIEAAWLRDLFCDDMATRQAVAYDPASKQVLATEETVFRDLVIARTRGKAPSEEQAARALAVEVTAGRLVLKEWNYGVEQFIARVNTLSTGCPDWGLEAFGEEARLAIVEQVCLGARGYKDIKRRPVLPVVRKWLSKAQRGMLDTHAPLRVALPNGRNPKVVYASGKPPHIALRIQELYDVNEPVTIAAGRITVQVHVLAPNQRPVQITDNLASFWREGYPRVKKDLRGRYPKHEWR